MHLVVKAILKGIKTGRYDLAKDIVNQVIGTPKTVQEIQTPFADLNEIKVTIVRPEDDMG